MFGPAATALNVVRKRKCPFLVLRLADWLVGRTPRSVLLVGPSGVGKTAAVHQTVRQRGTVQLAHTPFWTTSGARLIAGMCGFGMWQQRCRELVREASRTKAVIHFGNLVELMQVGQYEGADQGVGDFLRPHIARGDLLAIAECTPEQLTMLERQAPNMIEAFVQLEIKEPDSRQGRRILQRFVRKRSGAGRDRLNDDALDVLDRLHRRYATYSAYPGRPLRFVNNLLEDAPREKRLDGADVTAAFSRESGLPRMLLEDDASLDLDQARQWFGERVIGQPRAVDVVVDTLATVKAWLTRPERPIASLLFVGPTGVGKTETAKALAEFLYQDRNRMTRVDMSEYADALAVERLFGGISGDEGLLTSKVREQPFGVVLLDEFEKAHPRFLDLLLQVLGEGRLTDAAVRLGYDPRYGARPIKRAIDRRLLAPLATVVNEHSFQTPLAANVEVTSEGIRVSVRGPQAAPSRADADVSEAGEPLTRRANQTIQLRRETVAIDRSHVLRNMRNRIYRLQKTLQRQESRQLVRGLLPDPIVQAELARLQRLVGRIDELVERVTQLEENTLIARYTAKHCHLAEIQGELQTRRAELDTLRMDLYESAHGEHNFLNLVVYGESSSSVLALTRAYHAIAERRGFRTALFEIQPCAAPLPTRKDRFQLGDRSSKDPKQVKQANNTSLMAQRVSEPAEYLGAPQDGFIGLALTMRGQLAQPQLGPEAGLHVVIEGAHKTRSLVHASSNQMTEYQPPQRIDRRDAVGGQEVRRTYHRTREMIEDKRTGKHRRWTGEELESAVESLVDEHFQSRIAQWFQS